MNLEIGMYVRCPVDDEDLLNPRKFAMGQIVEMNPKLHEAKVIFYDFKKVIEFFDYVPESEYFDMDEIEHCKILDESEVIIDGNIGKIISARHKEDNHGFYEYYVTVTERKKKITKVVNERDIKVQFTRADINPIKQFKKYEFHNPIWYKYRNKVSSSKHTLKNAAFGFQTLVGSRVHLLSHQVDTIIRAVNETPCRLMLADEVGLGKTIEACVIMKGLKEKNKRLRTLIIAPDSLVNQWKNELSLKFWMDIPIFEDKASDYRKTEDLIIPLEKINSPEGQKILQMDWGLCIIDETHRLIGMEDEYELVKDISNNVKNLLLLSATPIQQRKTEYLKLLSLLKPEIYEHVTIEKFQGLLDKQAFIRSKVHQMMRDIKYYIEDELAEDYIDDLEDIADELGDKTFKKIVGEISIEKEDQGLEQVKLALTYLGEHYQIERRIIRHRRLELESIMPKRNLELVSYDPVGSDFYFYEVDLYEELIKYLEKVSEADFNIDLKGEFIRIFLSAMFSSPWALEGLLEKRLSVIREDKIDINQSSELYMLNTPRKEGIRKEKILSSVNSLNNEINDLENLLELCRLWGKGSYDEFDRLQELYNDPDLIKGRLIKILDYLCMEYEDTKFVLFTSWTETLVKMEELLQKKFGEEAVATFYAQKTQDELQEAADKFQSQSSCRFMLCDELGGEGRNFQMADAIIHIDLPWSPIKLEQRIGRLDRVGRDIDKEVLSVVFNSTGTIEEDLFSLWDEGLNVFNESLSGLEIVLQEIHHQIVTALGSDMKYGLKDALENVKDYSKQMTDLVDQERYFDLARHLDINVQRQLEKLIASFNENDGEGLADIMMDWANLTGLIPRYEGKSNDIIVFSPNKFSVNAFKNTMLIPPDMEEARKRARKQGEIRGTFSRSRAIEREDLIFFAPGDPFFDAITDNALECSRGRSASFIQESNINWKGFVFRWSIGMDLQPLLDLGESMEQAFRGYGYLSLDQFITVEAISKEYTDIADEVVLQEIITEFKKSKFVHLGQRSKADKGITGQDFISNLQWFQHQMPANDWEKLVEKSYKDSYKKVKNKIEAIVDIKRAKEDFERYLYGIKAAILYYGKDKLIEESDHKKMIKIYEGILKGLKEPKIELDSVAYVWMVNRDA